MYKRDQIKGIIALILFGAIGLSYLIFNEEISKIISVVCLIIWLASMYFLNKRKEK